MELKKRRVVFAGAARNCAAFLPRVLENMARLAALYENAAFVIAENDSDDETKALVRSWLCRQSDGHLITLDGLAAVEQRRTQRIATARNACLDHIRSGKSRDHDHLIMLDFDAVNSSPISLEAFSSAVNFLDQNPAAAGVFANQAPAYYDVWALRHPTWCPRGCWDEVAAKPRWMRHKTARILYVHRRQLSIPGEARPIRVRSAFGGFGLYKTSSILRGRYEGIHANGSEACEHVAFNEQICDRGQELYIFPGLFNQAPNEHLFDPRLFGRRDRFVMGAIRLWQATFPPWKRLYGRF